MTTHTLTLPYPVSANRYWRSFVPRGGNRAITVVSDEAKAYREECAWRAMAAGLRPLKGRVLLELWLYPSRPQDWQKRARKDPDTWDDTVQCIDLGNAEKVLSDALNGVAWEDDKQHRKIIKERMPPDEHGARVVIRVSQIESEAVAPQLFAEAS